MKAVTFGEIMLRLKTPEYLRIVQAQNFEASYGGAEANVAAGLAMLKEEAALVTKLPDNPVGQAALNELRRYGTDTTHILRGGKRLGIYYFEKGNNIRPTNVVYDRADSAFACSKPDEYDWDQILEDTDIFFFSGVTPAVSESVKETVLDALRCCKRKGIEVVCDLNYRAKMWDKNTAQCVMRELMPYVTLCIANDEDFEASLGIHAFDGDMSRGIEQIDTYREGMQEITRQFPNCKAVASVLRSMYTVEDGDWMAIYLIGDQFYETPVHHVHSLEAVGAGDAFAAALIHMLKKKENPQYTIDFSIAASVLKLMIQHDFNIVTEEDIIRVMKSNDIFLQR